MTKEFNDLPWHDTELKKIIIDRSLCDDVKLLIKWPDSTESCVIFFNCYALHADMHFGIIPPDFILNAECIFDSPDISKIKNTWMKMGLDISGLRCYRIETNSTNSIIEIFAIGFKITISDE